MAKKFDTNPLDPEFPEKAKAAAEPMSNGYRAPQRTQYSTSEFPTAPTSVTEDETRRFEGAQLNSYTFQGGSVPAAYPATPPAPMQDTRDRPVAKVGLPEKWLIALPYVPFWIGMVAGLVLLLVLPKDETKVRFHAAQGLAAHVGILIVTTLLGIVGNITDLAEIGNIIFQILTTVMLIVFAVKAWKGQPILIRIIEDLTNWLEEKIGPVKT